MRVDASLRVSFEASQETLSAIARRELRLTKYAFGPARDGSVQGVEEAIAKQVERIFKYETYGFNVAGGTQTSEAEAQAAVAQQQAAGLPPAFANLLAP